MGGITDGLAAVDSTASDKDLREGSFPWALLDKALEFKCMEGQASVPADADRIKGAIEKLQTYSTGGLKEQGSTRLDRVVHGVVALSALSRVLGTNDSARRAKYMRALQNGEHREVRLDLDDLVQIQENPHRMGTHGEPSYEDQLMSMLNESAWQNKPAGVEESAVNEVVEALSLRAASRGGVPSLEVLEIKSPGTVWLSERLGSCSKLRELNLEGCKSLKSLPKRLRKCTALTRLNLAGCTSLMSLPDLSGVLGLRTLFNGPWELSKEGQIVVDENCHDGLMKAWKAAGFKAMHIEDGEIKVGENLLLFPLVKGESAGAPRRAPYEESDEEESGRSWGHAQAGTKPMRVHPDNPRKQTLNQEAAQRGDLRTTRERADQSVLHKVLVFVTVAAFGRYQLGETLFWGVAFTVFVAVIVGWVNRLRGS